MKQKIPARVLMVGSIAGVFALLALIQIFPFGKNHANPALVAEPKWDSPQTRELAKRACFDCHSNQTVWPTYSNSAPISWIIGIDVADGRSAMNFSDWTAIPELDTREIGAVVLEGDMPPGLYLLLHPDARLSPDEVQQLADGLTKSLTP